MKSARNAGGMCQGLPESRKRFKEYLSLKKDAFDKLTGKDLQSI